MMRRMPARTFQRWLAYHDLEPFDEKRADFRAAQVVAAVKNLHRREPIRVKDCLLTIGAEEPPAPRRQTWQEQKMIAQMFAQDFTDERRS